MCVCVCVWLSYWQKKQKDTLTKTYRVLKQKEFTSRNLWDLDPLSVSPLKSLKLEGLCTSQNLWSRDGSIIHIWQHHSRPSRKGDGALKSLAMSRCGDFVHPTIYGVVHPRFYEVMIGHVACRQNLASPTVGANCFYILITSLMLAERGRTFYVSFYEISLRSNVLSFYNWGPLIVLMACESSLRQ